METGPLTNFVTNLRAGPRSKNTDRGIRKGKSHIQNVHTFLTVCSMEQKQASLRYNLHSCLVLKCPKEPLYLEMFVRYECVQYLQVDHWLLPSTFL